MKRNRWKLLTLLIAAVVLITTVTLSVYAYFSTRVYVYTEDGREVAHLGMNLQLLFGKLKPDSVQDTVYDENGNVTTTGAPLKIPYYENNGTHNIYHEGGDTDSPTFDSTKPWGSPQNPYIIANERHLQNLSALQNIGYFDLMYISTNFTYNEEKDVYDVRKSESYCIKDIIQSAAKDDFGHGGGDQMLIKDFYNVLVSNTDAQTTLEKSIESHLMALASEKSRKSGVVVSVHKK